MSYGIVEYDADGKPVCEICGKSFHRVLAHVRQVHYLTHSEYKKMFGFDIKKGICSKESSEIARENVLANYDKCIQKNLIKGGEDTRFEVGSKGRTRDKVSEQTRIRLTERIRKIRKGIV